MTQTKATLRQYFLSQRRSLSNQAWRTASDQICDNLRHHPPFQQAKTVLSFTSYRNEPDLEPLFITKNNREKNWALPRCVGKDLAWHCYRKGDRLVSGKYGITEPHPDLPLLDLTTIDVILVPAVACTKNGDRLGYGGGFYDRFFASLPPNLTEKLTTIGIIFECCLAETLPTDPWDKKLDFICTEKQIYCNQ